MSRSSRVEDRRRHDRHNDRRDRARRRKRKEGRSCCSSCIISLVVLFVITAGLLYGGGTFAWNQYAKPMFGISFNDALGLVGSTYVTKEKDVINNAYGEGDVDAFYTNLSNALFLDEDVKLRESLDEVLDSFIEKMANGETNGSGSGTGNEEIATEEELTEGSSTPTTTGNEALDNFLKSLDFDFSRLKDYEDEYATPEVLSLTDKQTAAFLDDTIKTALKKDAIKGKLPELVQNVSLENIVDIPQVIVAQEGPDGDKQTALTLTVRINLRETIKEVASAIHPALKVAAYLLPKKLLATITIYPDNYIQEAKIRVNSFSDKRMNDAYAIANYFLKDTQYESVNGILTMVNQKAIEALEKVRAVVPVYFLETGSVEMHPIQALMNVLGATEVTETQFFCMIRDLFLPEFDDVKQALGFEEDDTYEGIAAKLAAGKTTLVGEISNKYAIEPGYLTADNMMDKLKGVGGESSELIEKISLSNLDLDSEIYNANDVKVRVPYVALAGLLSGYLNEAASGGEGGLSEAEEGESSTSKISFEMINATYSEAAETLTIVLKIGVLDMLGTSLNPDSPISGVVSKLVPENIYIRASVCLADSDESPATIMINNRDAEGTVDLLNTIGALVKSLGSESGLDYTSLSQDVATKARTGLKDLNTQLGNAITFKNDAAYLPSLYDIMANKILYKEELDADNLTSEEVYAVFRGVVKKSAKIDGTNVASDLSGFVATVNTSYSINNAHKLVAPTTDSDPTIVEQMQAFGTNYNTAIDGTNGAGTGLADRWKDVQSDIEADASLDTADKILEAKASAMKASFNPYAKQDEAAAIFDGAFKVTTSGIKDVTLNKVIVEDDSHIRLIYSCTYETDESTKYASLIPDFVINVLLDKEKVSEETYVDEGNYAALDPTDLDTIYYMNDGGNYVALGKYNEIIDTSLDHYYTFNPCVEIRINSMEDTELDNFALMCTRLGINSFNMDSIRTSTNTSVKDGLKDLFKKVDITLDATQNNEKIYFGSIFELAYKNVYTPYANKGDYAALDPTDLTTIYYAKDGDDYIQLGTYSQIIDHSLSAYYIYYPYVATDVADTIAALYGEIAVLGQNGIDADADKFDPVYDSTTNSDGIQASANVTTLNMQGKLTARNIGAAILGTDMSTLKTGMGYTGELELVQSLMINVGDSTYAAQNTAFMNEVSNLFVGVTNEQYVVSEMSIATASLYESTLIPENMYLTIRIDVQSGEVRIAYNNLSEKELLVLKSMAGTSGAKAFDVITIEKEMETFIRTVELFTYTYIYPVTVTFGDVLDAHAGSVNATLNDSKLCGKYELNYTRSI